MTTTQTVTRRHDNVTIQTGLTWMQAIQLCEQFPNVDHIIHNDGTDWMEEKAKAPYDITQGGWAFI